LKNKYKLNPSFLKQSYEKYKKGIEIFNIFSIKYNRLFKNAFLISASSNILQNITYDKFYFFITKFVLFNMKKPFFSFLDGCKKYIRLANVHYFKTILKYKLFFKRKRKKKLRRASKLGFYLNHKLSVTYFLKGLFLNFFMRKRL